MEASDTACQSRCANTKGCNYFTFWPDGGCHIQDSNAQLRSFAALGSLQPSATHGPALCAVIEVACATTGSDMYASPGSTEWSGMDMSGQDRTMEASDTACQSRCANTKGCNYFTFWPDGGCHIQD